jgi:RES domain-containing protein
MRVYRITRAAYARDLSGKGAAHRGNRWNSKETPILYCANSTALAALELRVNIDIDLPDLFRIVLDIPDDAILADPPVFFADCGQSQKAGDAWAQRRSSLCLKVYSAILPGAEDSFNILINPAHPDSGRIVIVDVGPFRFDPRLF